MVASRAACCSVMRTRRPVMASAASISDPAMAKRMVHITAGGSRSWSAMPMARYVEPQKTYTSANAKMTLRR